MEKEMLQSISKSLMNCLPEKWEKVCVYIQETESSYDIFFHVKVNGVYIQCFNLEKDYGVTRKELRSAFKEIAETVKNDQNEKKWYVMTFLLSNDGKFSIEYEYNDYSDNSIAYKNQWKDKYLV